MGWMEVIERIMEITHRYECAQTEIDEDTRDMSYSGRFSLPVTGSHCSLSLSSLLSMLS